MSARKTLFLYLIFWMFGIWTIVAAEKYGDAQVESGLLTVLRGGSAQEYAPSPDPVEIQKNDVLRTGAGTSVVMMNQDQTKITIGSNAILQTKEWKRQNSGGVLRMLFGKFKALTSDDTKKDANILTTTGVIGIKGSEGFMNVDGDRTVLSNISGNMEMEGTSIDPGQSGLAVDDGKGGLAATFKTPEGATDSVDTADPKVSTLPAGVSEADLGAVSEVTPDEATVAAGVSPPSAADTQQTDVEESTEEEKDEEKKPQGALKSSSAPSVEEISSAVNNASNATSGIQDNTDTQTTGKGRVGISVEK